MKQRIAGFYCWMLSLFLWWLLLLMMMMTTTVAGARMGQNHGYGDGREEHPPPMSSPSSSSSSASSSSRSISTFLSFPFRLRRNKDGNDDALWYELPPEDHLCHDVSFTTSSSSSSSFTPRKNIWWGRYDDDQTWKHTQQQQQHQQQQTDQGTNTLLAHHPLRSSRYHVTVLWGSDKNTRSIRNTAWPRDIELEFDVATGYCRATTPTITTTTTTTTTPTGTTCRPTPQTNETVCVGIGHWSVHPWGLSCRLWMNINENNHDDSSNIKNNHNHHNCSTDHPVQVILTAGVHLNPFGTHAKLLQGSIVQVHDYHSHYSHDDDTSPLMTGKNDGTTRRGIPDPIQDEPMVPVGPNTQKWFRPVVGRFAGRSL
jgi:hypothetical protein